MPEIQNATVVPVATEMVEVVSPADLKGGYTFMAEYNGQTFRVTVPPGGVMEGQRMTVPFQPTVSELSPLTSGPDNTTRGVWKDGLCDCLKYGCCHPSFLNACCFPQILMAQVMTRLKMNMCADYAPEPEWKATFKRMLVVVVSYWIVSSMLAPPPSQVVKHHDGSVTVVPDEDYPLWESLIYNIVTTAFGLYTFIVLMKLRATVRQRYEIPEKHCIGMEDCCCSFWCGCCTIAQISRQTADYDQRRAVCCSDSGLPTMTPAIIV